MRIRRIQIENFRCLETVEVMFEDITTFLGPNGAGKSSVLRALDWFFNGTKATDLTIQDVYMADTDRTVSVTVEFDDLTTDDRERLGNYASSEGKLIVKKQWFDGQEKTIGRALVFEPFEAVRSATSAADKKVAYATVIENDPSVDLPRWTNQGAVAESMAAWESANPNRLTNADVDAASHFFGFAGKAIMSGLFDFIFVSADMRASEEAADTKGAVIGRILEQTIDRTAADTEFADLYSGVADMQAKIHANNYSDQLDELSTELTKSVSLFAPGKTVSISADLPELKPPRAQFQTVITDQEHDTTVDRQGHGFQRALLIAALKLLAERGAAESNGVICLAVEEPELYQHPQQARTFAAVLRELAEDSAQNFQVAYATHSPYFVEPRSFGQIRRVTNSTDDGRIQVSIVGSNIDKVVERLDTFMKEDSVRKQLDGVCMGAFSEAFFADVVLIVEGSTDRAILNGLAARESVHLLRSGIFIGEAGGKQSLLLPHVVLDELGIASYLVADNDSHLASELERANDDGDPDKIKKKQDAVDNSVSWNRLILRFFGASEEDLPAGSITPNLTFVEGGLEAALASQWPEWADKRDELVSDGEGYSGKNSATYEQAAREAEGAAPNVLTFILSETQALKVAA